MVIVPEITFYLPVFRSPNTDLFQKVLVMQRVVYNENTYILI